MCGSSSVRKELGGCSSYQMVSRYARGNAGERAVMAHKASVLGVKYSVGHTRIKRCGTSMLFCIARYFFRTSRPANFR